MAEAAAVSPPDLRRAARRGLAVYFGLVVVLSGPVEAYMIMNPEVFGTTAGILTLMWTPALASVIARLVLREGFSDVSFRFGGLRTLPWYALGLGVPLAVGILAYGAAWLTAWSGSRAARAPSWWGWYPPLPGSRSTASSSRRGRR